MKRITVFLLSILLFSGVSAQEDVDPNTERAMIVISEMGQRLAGLESFQLRSDSTFDEPFSGQLVEYSQSTEVFASRSQGFRMNTRGDLMNSSAYFNGTDFVMYDRDKKFYAMAPFTGTLSQLTDYAAKKLGVVLPAAELLHKDPAEALLEDIDTLFYVGMSQVDGATCHHVAGRNKNGMEWEIWVEDGLLLPRKMVVRDPSLEGSPRSVALLSHWKINPSFPDMMFHFLIPQDATQIEMRVPESGGNK